MRPEPRIIKELVRRITSQVRPTRIILFGSAARGNLRLDSDLDVLVVVASDDECEQAWRDLSGQTARLGRPVDLLVATEADLRCFGDNWSLVYYWAIREGEEIYVAGRRCASPSRPSPGQQPSSVRQPENANIEPPDLRPQVRCVRRGAFRR